MHLADLPSEHVESGDNSNVWHFVGFLGLQDLSIIQRIMRMSVYYRTLEYLLLLGTVSGILHRGLARIPSFSIFPQILLQ
jgi:hypothetical protein